MYSKSNLNFDCWKNISFFIKPVVFKIKWTLLLARQHCRSVFSRLFIRFSQSNFTFVLKIFFDVDTYRRNRTDLTTVSMTLSRYTLFVVLHVVSRKCLPTK